MTSECVPEGLQGLPLLAEVRKVTVTLILGSELFVVLRLFLQALLASDAEVYGG